MLAGLFSSVDNKTLHYFRIFGAQVCLLFFIYTFIHNRKRFFLSYIYTLLHK